MSLTPPSPDADLRTIGRYAESLGVRGGPEARALLDRALESFRADGRLPESAADLRTCLAVFWAVLPYVAPHGPAPAQERFLRALVRGLG